MWPRVWQGTHVTNDTFCCLREEYFYLVGLCSWVMTQPAPADRPAQSRWPVSSQSAQGSVTGWEWHGEHDLDLDPEPDQRRSEWGQQIPGWRQSPLTPCGQPQRDVAPAGDQAEIQQEDSNLSRRGSQRKRHAEILNVVRDSYQDDSGRELLIWHWHHRCVWHVPWKYPDIHLPWCHDDIGWQ